MKMMLFLYIAEFSIPEFLKTVFTSALFLIWILFWKSILPVQNIYRWFFTRKWWFYELIVFGQFYHFFGLIFSNHYCLDNPTQNRKDYKRILQLKQVLEFIEKNYANPLTLQQLSASVSMSPKYFCRFFSEMTHQTPMDYLNRQRIEEACYQLAATDDSITEIAYRNGFNDLSYFIRTFKKYKGTTPGKYKRR